MRYLGILVVLIALILSFRAEAQTSPSGCGNNCVVVPNSSSGTNLNGLAFVFGGQAFAARTGDTPASQYLGIVVAESVSGCKTACTIGTATIAYNGRALCNFDAGTNAYNWVIPSIINASNCTTYSSSTVPVPPIGAIGYTTQFNTAASHLYEVQLSLQIPSSAVVNTSPEPDVVQPPVIPISVINIPCNTNINTVIQASGGGTSHLSPVVYQLAGTPISPCTYTAPNSIFHTASHIRIRGYIDPVNNPIGAATILDGGQGSTSTAWAQITCGYPYSGGPSCPGGSVGDNTSDVVLEYLTVQHSSGSDTCPTNITPGCGSGAGGLENGSQPLSTWNNWILDHFTSTLQGGCGLVLLGGNVTLENSKIYNNRGCGAAAQTGFALGNNGGPIIYRNNEFTANNLRGDDTNDSAACGGKNVSRQDLGGPSQSIIWINNYIHDCQANGIWFDIAATQSGQVIGNTIKNLTAIASGPNAGHVSDGIRDEITLGPVDIGHNVIINASSSAISIDNSSNVKVHDNFVYVDVVGGLGSGGIFVTAQCRVFAAQPPLAISGISVYGNIVTFTKTGNNGQAGIEGVVDQTGPFGTACPSDPHPTNASMGSIQFGNSQGNVYYTPTTNDRLWVFGASGNAVAPFSWVQNDFNPLTGPVQFAVTASMGSCFVNVTATAGTIFSGGVIIIGGVNSGGILAPYGTAGATGTGGMGTYALDNCPTVGGGSGTYYFPGSQETSSTEFTGAIVTGYISSSGLMTVTAVTSGIIPVGGYPAANDGTHIIPYGLNIAAFGTNGTTGTGTTGTYQLSGTLPFAVASSGSQTTIYINAQFAQMYGCTTPITSGGCPNGSGI